MGYGRVEENFGAIEVERGEIGDRGELGSENGLSWRGKWK